MSYHHAALRAAGKLSALHHPPTWVVWAFLACGATGVRPAAAVVQGKFARQAERKGEVTDTSPKSSTYCFVNDRYEAPRELAIWVDTEPARWRHRPDLLPLRVAVHYAGKGGECALEPHRFVLRRADPLPHLVALDNEELHSREGGSGALRRDRLRAQASGVVAPPFGKDDGRYIPTAFHSEPSLGVLLNDQCHLWPGTWFCDWAWFDVGSEPVTGTRMELAFVDAEGEDLVVVSFRVERDPWTHRRAFRKAERVRKQEDAELRHASQP